MNTANADWFDYCSDLVQRRDEDRWLASRYAAADRRGALVALYALHLELARIPASVSEPPLGEIRLQWWRDAVEEVRSGVRVRAHPVVAAMAATDTLRFAEEFMPAIDARARLLYGEPFATAAAFEDWIAAAQCWSVRAAARVFVPELGAGAIATLDGAARAYELACCAPLAGGALRDEVSSRALALHEEHKAALAALPADVMPAIAFMALTPVYAAGHPPSPIGKRLRMVRTVATGRF